MKIYDESDEFKTQMIRVMGHEYGVLINQFHLILSILDLTSKKLRDGLFSKNNPLILLV